MTGIERLREFVAGISPFTVVCGVTSTAHDGERTEEVGVLLRDFLADIADRIEREHTEDCEAIAWVREHGGIDHVRAEWRSRVPHDRYERRRQRLLGHIAECETALGRRREIISELTHHVKALANENVELRRRAMPEGYEWPCYESGESVGFGDDVSRHGEDFEANVIALYRDGSFSLNFRAYSKGERVRRPAVLAADGEPLEVGQTVYATHYGYVKCTVLAIEWVVDGYLVEVENEGGHKFRQTPDEFTHQRPVLDADGAPIKKDEHVFGPNGGQYRVTSAHDGKVFARHVDGPSGAEVESAGGEGLYRLRADKLTHERPDSWERIERDAKLGVNSYRERYGIKKHDDMTWPQLVREDIVRRCHALAERERGER